MAVAGVLTVVLTGCGSTMRNYLEKDTPEQTAAVRQDLSLPPDLRLPPPGSAPAAAEPSVYDSTNAAAVPAPANPSASARRDPATTIYEQAGISLYKPDGTRKTEIELREELRKYRLAQKQQSNPNYGTVFNLGNVFRDE